MLKALACGAPSRQAASGALGGTLKAGASTTCTRRARPRPRGRNQKRPRARTFPPALRTWVEGAGVLRGGQAGGAGSLSGPAGGACVVCAGGLAVYAGEGCGGGGTYVAWECVWMRCSGVPSRHGTRPTPSRGKTPPGPGGGPRPLPVSPVDLCARAGYGQCRGCGASVWEQAHLLAGARRMKAFAVHPAGLGCMVWHKPRQNSTRCIPDDLSAPYGTDWCLQLGLRALPAHTPKRIVKSFGDRNHVDYIAWTAILNLSLLMVICLLVSNAQECPRAWAGSNVDRTSLPAEWHWRSRIGAWQQYHSKIFVRTHLRRVHCPYCRYLWQTCPLLRTDPARGKSASNISPSRSERWENGKS